MLIDGVVNFKQRNEFSNIFSNLDDINMMSLRYKRLLSVREAGEYLGLSPRTIYNKLKSNNLKSLRYLELWGKQIRVFKLGRKVVFDLRDLDEFIDNLKSLDIESNEQNITI